MWDGLQEDFASRLRRLIAASNGRVSLLSGYRSPDKQRQLWEAAVRKYGSEAAARKWVAPPGKSNHNRGIAADLSGDLELAKKLAPMFGLVFPMGHEPWHIEPMHAHETADPDAYTEGPDGSTTSVNYFDIGTQLAAFIDGVERGPNVLEPQAPEEPMAPGQEERVV